MTIAIIGAGMAGLACADALAAKGQSVRLFDKGRGPGGRMSTRRVMTDAGEAAFDHGAQYFTARDPGFAALVAKWEAAGVVARWPAVGPEAWIGTPAMNAPIKAMASAHIVAWGVRVEAIRREEAGWMLITEAAQFGPFDAVALAIPAEQVPQLIRDHAPDFAALAEETPAAPCWTLMLAFEQAVAFEADIIRDSGAIGWAARNNPKPGRSGPESWVIQGSPTWSVEHLDDRPVMIMEDLRRALQDHVREPLPPCILATVHLWRYARSGAAGKTALWDDALKLGVCGDWLIGPRVECAWLSGSALGQMI
jgi:renalase